MKPDGTRCRCVIARKYLNDHYVRNFLGIRVGYLLCENHWKVVHRGRRVRLKAESFIFSAPEEPSKDKIPPGGIWVYSRQVMAAAGVISIHRREKTA
jgi:hypothetical protein